MDCFVVKDNRAIWMTAAYARYAEIARELGLDAGYFWPSEDAVHIQEEKDPSPPTLWVDVERAMVAQYDFSSVV